MHQGPAGCLPRPEADRPHLHQHLGRRARRRRGEEDRPQEADHGSALVGNLPGDAGDPGRRRWLRGLRRVPGCDTPHRNRAQNSRARWRQTMTNNNPSEAAKAVVRRNTEEVQGGGNFEVFEELFADDFLDHTPQPGRTPDKDGATTLQNPPCRIPRLSRRHPLADRRWRARDNVQDLSRDAPGRVLGRGADGPENSIRDRRRHARAQRQDRRALGCGKPLLSHAAARRLAHSLSSTHHSTLKVKGTPHLGSLAVGGRLAQFPGGPLPNQNLVKLG